VLASSSGTIAVSENADEIADETFSAPLDIVSRWPYYASKAYQEMAALERFSGKGLRLVIMNPSLLLGPGDDRLSSTKVVMDFMARKIGAVPNGGLNFVDVRDTAEAFRVAMQQGRHGERYLLGAVNWTFVKFFNRLERLTKVASPRLAFPSKFAVAGAHVIDSLFRQWNFTSPVQADEVEMAEYYWYFNSNKAKRELGFAPRDPGDTLNDTVQYVRENFLGGK
jgi:dihydroflavonol-4-reductase